MATMERAQALAQSLVRTSCDAGLPARALITDMDVVLGHTAGNGLEVAEAIAFLRGDTLDPRQRQLTLALCAELLHLGGLATSFEDALAQAERALVSGAAAERFARMVAGLGGPRDVLHAPGLLPAPVVVPVAAPQDGYVGLPDVRALGLVVVQLGGGRVRAGEAVDPRVGLSQLLPPGTRVARGDPLAFVHAADAASAADAVQAALRACRIADTAPAPGPVVLGRVV